MLLGCGWRLISRRVKLYFVVFITFVLLQQNVTAQVVWNFEKTHPLEDTIKGQVLSLKGRLTQPELVNGVSGAGLRTDGYSTFLTTKFLKPWNIPFHLSGYFALETYPTDTAGFFTLYNSEKNIWISACIDRFGTPMIGVNTANKIVYYSTNNKLDKFKWLNISLNIQQSNIQLIINELMVKSVPLPDSLFEPGLDSLVIGNDGRKKTIGIFPVTLINGIIDQVEISGSKLSGEISQDAQLKKYLKLTPRLAIPESRFAGDFNRPLYHLLPAANWTNETHGLIYYKGQYHIFNQKNGANLFLGQINWGHFTSPDLIHWKEQRPALTPEPGYDQNGIWSGCAVIDGDGKPAIFYTAGGENSFGISLARPTDENLITWKKFEGNPIIPASPKEYSRQDFHDTYVWKEGNTWYMIVGFGLVENSTEKGTVLLYKSDDMLKWNFVHPLFIGDPVNDDSGVFWEMPVFLKMNGKYILLVNKVPYKGKPAVALYWTGNFINESFVPDDKQPKRLEVINRLLSPSVAYDAAGKVVAIGIIPDETSAKETYEQGWTHLYSIPRVWTLKNGKIDQQPYPQLKELRKDEKKYGRQLISPDSNFLLSAGNHQLEITVDIMPGTCNKFGFIVGANKIGTEFTKIYFDLDKKQLVVDQTKSSLRKYTPLHVRKGDYRLEPGKKINIHLFIDGSVIEGFINDEDAFTTRLFPQQEDSDRVEIFTENGDLKLLKADVWSLNSSNSKTAF